MGGEFKVGMEKIIHIPTNSEVMEHFLKLFSYLRKVTLLLYPPWIRRLTLVLSSYPLF
jgi:hypothetical protein